MLLGTLLLISLASEPNNSSQEAPQYRTKSINAGCQTISPRSSLTSQTVFMRS
jgi:hypothetical protein